MPDLIGYPESLKNHKKEVVMMYATVLMVVTLAIPGAAQTTPDTTGAAPPTGDENVARPDTLIVEDYQGPDNSGDQGAFVLATFKHTPQHAQLSQYRIWREILVSIAADSVGKIEVVDPPRPTWVPWATVDAVPMRKGAPPVTRAIIPTIDNVATRWAITAEMRHKPSEATKKVAFSAESVQETLALLGIQFAMPAKEALKMFGPSYNYARAIRGDQPDILIGTLDLDGLRRVAMQIPEGPHPTGVLTSDATVAAAPGRAIDNIPPAGVSDEKGEAVTEKREVTLIWTVPRDDQIVGVVFYRGYAVPIPGVRTYDILRGTEENNLQRIASVPAGSTTFKDVVPADLGNKLIYQIDTTDLDNVTKGQPLVVTFK